MPDDNKNLFEDLKNKRKEISELRGILNQVNEQKEEHYLKKDEAGKDIRKLISEIKALKKNRDSFTAEVKKTKLEKQKVVDSIKEKISTINRLKKEKTEISRKHDLKGNPERLREQIDALEMKMQTEVQSFDNEQKMMKKIKLLQSKFGEFEVVKEVLGQINELSAVIDDLKSKEKNLKKEVRKNARESQNEHEKMLELSKRVDELKVTEHDSYEKFMEQKKVFTDINKKLKVLLKGYSDLRNKATDVSTKKKMEKEEKIKTSIAEKKSQVDEKIRKGEKLTTDDLLAFQG